MAQTNVETKARCDDLAAPARTLAAAGARHVGRLDQVDTYFETADGVRLKLRAETRARRDGTSGSSAELIRYARPDAAGARVSSYERTPVGDAAGRRAELAATLGVRGTVVKRRELWLLGSTRVHLDEVEGLGAFLELETIFEEGHEAAARREHDALVELLGIEPHTTIAGSYIDLGAPRRAPCEDRERQQEKERDMPREEGFVDVADGRVWFGREGEPGPTPLLILHGGPGAASYYLEPFAERMAVHRPTVVFDQLGCGRSDKPDDPSLWTFDRAVAEVDTVRGALGLERCHLLGQSWGGWLSIEYLSRGATGIAGLVLASTSASIPQFTAAARELIDALPEPHRTTLRELGARGEYEAPAYLEAVGEFYRRHLCRLDPWPACVRRTAEEIDGNQVYLTMNGPTEFDVIGEALRAWDRTADLERILVPTLVTCGRHDEITPACSETIAAGIPGARMVVFEHSAHLAHEEEPERYADVVEEFLASVDRRRGAGVCASA